jgi:hypothetical protein
MDGKGSSELPLGRRSNQADIKVRIGRSAIRPRTLWPLGADLLLYEDEIRSVEGPDAGRGGPKGTAP